ncbi:MAG: TIGR03576 family pyridoxal phosphate-dependent enzyme [Methanobacteriaceae archaeon]
MLLLSSEDEVRKREAGLRIIRSEISKNGRNSLYDLTGLGGGFPIKKEDMEILETYVGPAIFKERLEELGKIHLGGEKILAFNRTTAGILATILALVKKGDEVVHYLQKSPSHPATPRSIKLVGGTYKEFDNIDEFHITEKTALVMITGSTMDHDIIEKEDFVKVVEIAKSKNIPVFVDDASGARLRTIIYNQPRALDMGADIVITSTYKLMNGPRGGLMAGSKEFIQKIKSKAYEFGLEAQPPIIAGMVRALEDFTPEKMLRGFEKKKDIFKSLKKEFNNITETPTGIMLTAEGLMDELHKRNIKTSLSNQDVACIFAMLLLRDFKIVTIAALGMPGCSPTIRIDLASKDAEGITDEFIMNSWMKTFNNLTKIINNVTECEKVLYD